MQAESRPRRIPGLPRAWPSALLLLVLLAPAASADLAFLREKTFQKLEKEVARKKTQLEKTCAYVRGKADQFAADEVVDEFFGLALARAAAETPDREPAGFAAGQERFLDRYFTDYSLFGDALFVRAGGDIVYATFQPDYVGRNLFAGELAASNLAAAIRESERQAFVDFQFSLIAQEPVAFFAYPVELEGRFAGWFILQWAVNNLNFLFTTSDGLGRTGETILVNKEHFLLTDSRFDREATSLTMRLKFENIRSRFEDVHDSCITTDYRGRLVLCHFEVVDFLGTDWLVSAKIDESEVVTDYYRNNQRVLLDCILQQDFFQPAQTVKVFDTRHCLKVDMDEFVRGGEHATLYTRGVSTCTALVVAKPGAFAYLAHLSPYDRAYLGDVFFTDLAAQLIARLPDYEISRNEYVDMVFYVVSSHSDSIEFIVDEIVRGGFFLGQIHWLHRPDAQSASVYYDVAADELDVLWVQEQDGQRSTVLQIPGEATNLETKLMHCWP